MGAGAHTPPDKADRLPRVKLIIFYINSQIMGGIGVDEFEFTLKIYNSIL